MQLARSALRLRRVQSRRRERLSLRRSDRAVGRRALGPLRRCVTDAAGRGRIAAMPKPPSKEMAPLVAYALGLPGAHEDFPWGERVAKVAKKVFVFFGHGEDKVFGLSVKLPQSNEMALHLPFVTPTGYGLGKSGWVSASFTKKDKVPVDMLREWILESYRAVAPKTLVKQLDAGSLPAARTPAPKRKPKQR